MNIHHGQKKKFSVNRIVKIVLGFIIKLWLRIELLHTKIWATGHLCGCSPITKRQHPRFLSIAAKLTILFWQSQISLIFLLNAGSFGYSNVPPTFLHGYSMVTPCFLYMLSLWFIQFSFIFSIWFLQSSSNVTPCFLQRSFNVPLWFLHIFSPYVSFIFPQMDGGKTNRRELSKKQNYACNR